MNRLINTCLLLLFFVSTLFADNYETLTKDFVRGKANIQSMSVMTFGPEGILFIGDSQAGKIFALDFNDREKAEKIESFQLEDLESKLAGLMGTDKNGVLIHDMAVNPISQNIYLAVSRADALQLGFWKRANDIANASILLRINTKGEIEEVALDDISHSVTEVPAVIEEGEVNWRKSDQRTDAITDIAYDDNRLYVAGLSNEEFASALRVLDFPFGKEASFSTVEVWHVAHGKSETEAPIRTLLPYTVKGEKMILAAYTCTPFVTIPVEGLKNGEHIKSTTIAEFGWGNMPIDIVSYRNARSGKDKILMSNTSKALIQINADELEKDNEALTEALQPGEYAIGLPHNVYSIVGVSQMDNFGEDHILVLQLMPNGHLNLRAFPTNRL